MTGHQAFGQFGGTLVDQGHGFEEATGNAARAGSALRLGAAQEGQDAGAQLAARHGLQRGVDGLVREADRLRHTSECGLDLLRTQAPAQMVEHAEPELVAGNQLAFHARLAVEHPRAVMGETGVAPSDQLRTAALATLRHGPPAVAKHLAGDGGARALGTTGPGSGTALHRHLLVGSHHATSSPQKDVALGF